MIEYCKGSQSDMEDIIDFANYVFSQNERPHNFKTLLPKIYSDKVNTAKYHYLVKDDGKIKAMVLAYPSKLKVGNETLKTCGIGSVSVHPYARGCGYMKKLMQTALDDMKNDGCDISILGGQRQRYEYFGYEPCGMQINFTVTSANIRHAYKNLDCSDISFKLINFDDNDLIDKAYNLYKTQEFIGIRNYDEFFLTLSSWQSKIYAIEYKNEFYGYAVINGNSIEELILLDIDKLPLVLKSFITKENLDEIVMQVSLYEQQKIACLSKICEGYSLTTGHSFKIFNYKKVIKAFMELKATYTNMEDGDITIKIENENLLISVHNNNVTIKDSDEKPDIKFTSLEAMMHIFSPTGIIINKNLNCKTAFQSWFPLPLYISSVDCC